MRFKSNKKVKHSSLKQGCWARANCASGFKSDRLLGEEKSMEKIREELAMGEDLDIARLLDPMPVEDALAVLQFKDRDRFGLLMRKFTGMTVTAGPWFGGYLLMLVFNQPSDGRTLYFPAEINIPLEIAPVDVLGLLLQR